MNDFEIVDESIIYNPVNKKNYKIIDKLVEGKQADIFKVVDLSEENM